MNLRLRDAAESDLPILARMNKHLIEDEQSANPMGLSELAERMGCWMKEGWGVKLFVEAAHGIAAPSEKVVGYAVYQERVDEYFPDRPTVYLRQMFVEREKRGGGIGQQALSMLVEGCFPPQCTVMIDVLEVNVRGTKFWRKAGFIPQYTRMHLVKKPASPPDE